MPNSPATSSAARPADLPAGLIWQPPRFDTRELRPRGSRYCVVVVAWNEGERLIHQLRRMRERASLADILIADGGSRDGSTELDFLRECGVRTLLVTHQIGLGTAIRMGLAYALGEGYEGVVTVDGNGKDGVESLPAFLQHLDDGYDLVQGSRFVAGGSHSHTPALRHLAIRALAAPICSLAAGFEFTDPTNGFRACSRRYLLDPRLQPLRDVFVRFNMQHYLVCRATKLGYRAVEIPVRRDYPSDGSVPTKVVSLSAHARILWELLLTAAGRYDPRPGD